MPNRMSTRRKGFSLVEVVVALGILTVGLFAVLDLFVSSRNVTRDGMRRAKAQAAARSVLELCRAAGPQAVRQLYESGAGGERQTMFWPSEPVELESTRASWQARLSPVKGQPAVLEIEVAVGWDSGASDPLNAGLGESVRSVELVHIGP